MKRRFRRLAVLAAATLLAAGAPALADKIKHPTAVFSGLDKITGRIISFEAALGETVQFGSLQITPRVCYSRPPTEAPQTDAFAEVDEVAEDHSTHRIFSGWMFADSPGMHGVEHPVYDIWLTDCKGDGELIHEAPTVADAPADSGDLDLGPLSAARQAGRRALADADAEEAQGHSRRTRPARPQWAGRASDASRCRPRSRRPRRPRLRATLRASVSSPPTTKRRSRPPTSAADVGPAREESLAARHESRTAGGHFR